VKAGSVFGGRGETHSGHLAVAVERKPSGKHRLARILTPRQDGGDAGADGCTGDERGMADLDAVDIGDGIAKAGDAIERHTQIPGARLGLRVQSDGRQDAADYSSSRGSDGV
jgi:hypothetical protein